MSAAAGACKGNPNALAMAVIEACKLGDADKAKRYWKQLPASQRPSAVG